MWARISGLVLEGADDAVIEVLDLGLLLVGDLGLCLDHAPKLEYVVLDLLHFDSLGDAIVCARHLLDVRLELAHVPANNLGVDDFTLGGDLGLRCGGEGDYEDALAGELDEGASNSSPSL